LRASSDGQVLEVFHREGERAESGPAILFAPADRKVVRAEVDEAFVGKVRPGQRVSVTVPGPGGVTIEGVVSMVKPVMGDKRVFTREAHERLDIQVFEVFVKLAESDLEWPYGLEVDVVIEMGGSP